MQRLYDAGRRLIAGRNIPDLSMNDVVIIGAGPVGLACGIEAKRQNLSPLIIEKGGLVNSFLGYPTNMEFFSTPELMEIGGHPFPTLGYKPTREEGIEYYRRVAGAEALDVRLYERVQRVEGQDGTREGQLWVEHDDGRVTGVLLQTAAGTEELSPTQVKVVGVRR